MQLNDTLQLLALQLQLDPNKLLGFAGEDQLGGYHWNPELSRWKQGSVYAVEGQTIYALIRALKPQTVVEIGSWVGCSATHIATALSVNGSGHVTAVDINPEAGAEFPQHLASVRTMVAGDGIEWLAGQEDESIDLLFEDADHSTAMCEAIAALCKTKLKPGGVMLMHDAGHSIAYVGGGVQVPSPVAAAICAGLDKALGNAYRVYLAEPSDCGLAVYQRPKGLTFKDISAGAGWIISEGRDSETGQPVELWSDGKAYQEKPKREMITEDGETLEIIDAPPVGKTKRKTVAKRKPRKAVTQ